MGELPEKKRPEEVDARIIERYGVDVSRWVRARRKKAGLANVQYIRFRRFFVLLATQGQHEFYKANAGQVRNVKEKPIAFAGYSIGYHRGFDGTWHVSVRIHPERYRDVKARFMDLATKRTVGELTSEFSKLPFEPYAPVIRQLFNLLRAVNRARAVAGLEVVPVTALRLKRRIVFPFGRPEEATQEEDVAA